MNETERNALVEELARGASALNLHPYDLATTAQQEARKQQVDIYLMPIIERHLAAAAAPGLGLQNEITEWANARFGGKDDHQRFTKLQNEVAELGRLSVNNRDGIKDECADIMHLLFQYAYWYRFDLIQATRDKFEINKQRRWDPQPDGTFQHVKEATDE